MFLIFYNYTLNFIFYILVYHITQEMERYLVILMLCQLYINHLNA